MSFISTAARTTFSVAYQISPIWLTGGLFEAFSIGGTNIGMPIVAITEALATGSRDFGSLINGQIPTAGADINSYFCNFRPLPGGTLIRNEITEYPFYDQHIAANAQLQKPQNISLLMYCPANTKNPMPVKIATMLALKGVLQTHTNMGGTYTVVTPASIYTNCLLTALTDVSTGESNQAQFAYQWDFTQPLVAFPGEGSLFNQLFSAIGIGAPVQMNSAGALSWSGIF